MAALILQAVVLAGGSGSRFGGGKLLAPWRGGVLIDGALAAAFAAPVAGVTVVTGADAEAVERAVRSFAERTGQVERMTVVNAPDWAEGMAATLRAGIAAVPEAAGGALVFLSDMPLVPHEVLAPLAKALADGAPASAPEFDGKRGNPVGLAREMFDEIMELTGDQGARNILRSLGWELALVPTESDGVLIDVDTPADLPA